MKKDTAIFDIDGVLADYRLGLLWWINTHYPALRSKCYEHLARTDTWINADTMGVTYRDWLDILERFRMSGGKMTIPTFPNAKELLKFVKERMDLRIVLITSRPVDIYSHIYRDTVEWLKQNELHHDLLLWSRNKAEIVYKLRMIDECAFAVDDEKTHIIDYVRLNIETFWIDHYDKGIDFESPYVQRVPNLGKILDYLKKEVNIR